MTRRIGARQMRIARELARHTSRFWDHAELMSTGTTPEALLLATRQILFDDEQVTLTKQVDSHGRVSYLFDVTPRAPRSRDAKQRR